MGKIAKGIRCNVIGCKDDAVRSINISKAIKSGLNVSGKKAYLCKEHYKEYKKGSKKERRVERWRHGVP
ncbi:hypothetical protein GF319_14685 [Candidatus Bathyarchaeota archaeon]|nr:hypothetical protein [Candidatus Bathyarchaeota archaeon]